MTDRDFSLENGLLLGTAGWNRPAWDADYFPPDLPSDWRLAFLANDCDGVLLRPQDWCGLGRDETSALEDAIEATPETFVFLLQLPAGEPPPPAAFTPFSARPSMCLAAQPPLSPGSRQIWVADGDDSWVAPDGGQALVWTLDDIDLRALRERATTLPPGLRVLILDGPAASPAVVPQVRILLQLLGMA